MVRRWSYINQLNTLDRKDVRSVRIGSSNTIVNSLMFLRRRFPVLTRATRKGWSRRIHLNDIVFMTNVLIRWSTEYRFYRNYLRSSHYQFFTKDTYLSLNLTFSKSLSSRHAKSDVLGLGSSIQTRLVSYYSRLYKVARARSWAAFGNYSWSLTSFAFPVHAKPDTFSTTMHYPYASVLPSGSLVPAHLGAVRSDCLSLVLGLPFRTYQIWLTSLYALLVKLSLHTLL